MTKAQRTAYRLRHFILIAGLLYTVVALLWIALPLLPSVASGLFGDDFEPAGFVGTPLAAPLPDLDDRVAYGASALFVVGLLLVAQWAFLRPGRVWAPRLVETGRPLKSAVVAAAAMAMLLTVGLIALLLEIPDWWEQFLDDAGWKGVYPVMLILWGAWTWVFFVYWRQGDRYTKLGKMIRGLVAGSVVEFIIAIPAHVWATRERECYCARGTYTTLVLAGVVLLWAFGPGIILLYMHERYRHARLYPMCTKCGYILTGNESGVCPECGDTVGQAVPGGTVD
jgi:hypothetical protein